MAIQVSNLYEDNEDIQFHIEKMVDWQTIIPLREQNYADYEAYQKTNDENYAFAFNSVEDGVDQYKSILQGIGELSAKVFLPNARIIDTEGIKFANGEVIFPAAMTKNIQVLTENGYMGLLLPRKYGGMNVPNVTNAMFTELVATGDIGLGTLPATQDLGDIINKFASEELKQKYLPKIASGEMGAAMLLTEPNYGSDLQNAQTKGDVAPDGTVKVTGVKMWITHGVPHTPDGQVFLTVTRTVKRADGTFRSGGAGLSLVLVESKDAEIVSLEHKLGIHSSPTVQLSMDNAPGYLVGEEGKGLTEYTMTLMNAARLTVAAQSLGASEIAFREAKNYAGIREQFGVLIQEIPAVKKMLQEIEISVQASRALIYSTAQAVDMVEGLEEKYTHQGLTDKEIRKIEEVIKWSKIVKVLTPFSKLFAAEEANRNAYRAVQIHGGVGYSEEYDVARISRDARILSIYEGTSQLQVVAAIGGVSEAYSNEKSVFIQYQKELRNGLKLNSSMQKYVTKIDAMEKTMADLVAFYKEQSKEFKGEYAIDVVWAAVNIFISILYLKMASVDTSGKKEKFAKIFINDAVSIVNAANDRIKSQAEEYVW